MNYSYGSNADQYLNKKGLEHLIEQLDLKYNDDSGTVDLTDYYNKTEIDNLLSNIDTGGGSTGNDGVGIQSVELVNYELIVTLTDATVINLGNIRGEQGLQGIQGLDGAKGTDGKDGLDGKDGRGITSVVKTDTVGLVDTYTITYSDMTTSNFTVTNGADGSGGSSGGGSSTDIYSTDEIAIGTWIDGKTIYRKVVPCNFSKKATSGKPVTESFPHNITNLGTVTNYYAMKTTSTHIGFNGFSLATFSLPNITNITTLKDNSVTCAITLQVIMFHYGIECNNYKFNVVLEYTKTE